MSKQYEVGSMQQELLPTAYCLLLTAYSLLKLSGSKETTPPSWAQTVIGCGQRPALEEEVLAFSCPIPSLTPKIGALVFLLKD
jgi:hypothetical protein